MEVDPIALHAVAAIVKESYRSGYLQLDGLFAGPEHYVRWLHPLLPRRDTSGHTFIFANREHALSLGKPQVLGSEACNNAVVS